MFSNRITQFGARFLQMRHQSQGKFKLPSDFVPFSRIALGRELTLDDLISKNETSKENYKELEARQKDCFLLERKSHPHLKAILFNRFTAYTLSKYSPEQMVDQGGLRLDQCLAITRIVFFALPELALVFRDYYKGDACHLYAFPLTGAYFVLEGEYGKILSPGAFSYEDSKDSLWGCREVMKNKKKEGLVEFGPLTGRVNEMLDGDGAFKRFIEGKMKPAQVQKKHDSDYGFEVEVSLPKEDQTPAFEQLKGLAQGSRLSEQPDFSRGPKP